MRLIDADALKSALEMKVYNDYDDLLRTERLIDNAPTLPNPCGKPCAFERPYGEWITTNNIWADDVQNAWGHYKECSCCHNQEKFRTPFCQNCGADMRKEGEAE